METTPAISVLMPVYNAERYLGEAVESILKQSMGDFELLIVDDGSTDGSLAILKRFAERDRRVRLVSRGNTGIVGALNEMLGMARGEFLARMDGDDVSLSDRLELQAAYLRGHPECVALGSKVMIIDPDGDPMRVWNHEQSHEEIDALHLDGSRGAVMCHPSVMMRREAVAQAGGYRGEHYPAEDLDLFLRLAERGRVANLPRVLLKYRVHPASIGHARYAQQRAAIHAAVSDARRRRGLPEVPATPVAAREERAQKSPHGKWAWWALKGGYVATARKHAARCLVGSPLSLNSWRVLFCALRGY